MPYRNVERHSDASSECPTCGGSGYEYHTCKTCKGTGRTGGGVCPGCGGDGQQPVTCRTCKGRKFNYRFG